MPTSPRASVRQPLQERVAAAILDAAASVLAARGQHASMTDVAAAAGVARATVYRYFPNRQALLDELTDLAVDRAGSRLASARIDEISVPEGIARAVRALVDVGDPFIVLARERLHPGGGGFERAVAGRIRKLIERGQSTGAIRDDIPSAWLTDALVGVVVNVVSSPQPRGREDTVAAITSLFIDGARGSRRAA